RHASGKRDRFCTTGHDWWTAGSGRAVCTPPSRSAGDFAGPLLGLPIEAGNRVRVNLETLADSVSRVPLAAFVGQHQLVDGSQQTGLAPQYCLGFRIQ